MKPSPVLLALAAGLLTGCPSAWPRGQFAVSHALGEPARIHAWAFADAEPDADLELARGELRRQLSAAGWLEAPPDQAELLVELSLAVGEPDWVEVTSPLVVGIHATADVVAVASGDEPPEPYEPQYARAWPKGMELWIFAPASGEVAYHGFASAPDRASGPTTLTGALARELLASFPGPVRRRWETELPPYPYPRPTRAGATGGPGPAPAFALPPRLPCTDAVPVAVLRNARFWERPGAGRDVAFRTGEVTSGCATHAANGVVRVQLSDGREGYVTLGSVLFHPGP